MAAEHLLRLCRKTWCAFPEQRSAGEPSCWGWDNERFAVGDVAFHLVYVNLTDGFAVLIGVFVRAVHVNVHDVLCDHLHLRSDRMSRSRVQRATNPIALLIMLIFDDENHVETRQNGGLKIDILPPRVCQ